MTTDSPAQKTSLPGETPESPAADAAGIERLFREHNATLLRFVAAKLGSEHDAREVAQEAYVRLLSLDRPEAISFLRAFLFKTAANLALDRLRQRARRGPTRAAEDGDLATFDLSPDRQLESAQAMQIVRAALEELPDKCRRAFLMHRMDGLSCVEVADRMGIGERMVRMYVARAVEHLRTCLDETDVEGSHDHER